ncbi:MAG: hypothetical protein LBN39_00380 [Planctomycetaceae bacterium]|nr:hypothetical protein [Planctomycetaceae bacterium]
MQHSQRIAAGLAIPASKQDRLSDCLKDCNGYDLTAQLAVNADSGSPIAVVQAHLKTSSGFLSTMHKELRNIRNNGKYGLQIPQ